MLATVFANDTLDVMCPACNDLAKLSVDWLENNRRYACENCGSEVEIDSEKLLEGLKDVDRAIDYLKNSINRLRNML